MSAVLKSFNSAILALSLRPEDYNYEQNGNVLYLGLKDKVEELQSPDVDNDMTRSHNGHMPDIS